MERSAQLGRSFFTTKQCFVKKRQMIEELIHFKQMNAVPFH